MFKMNDFLQAIVVGKNRASQNLHLSLMQRETKNPEKSLLNYIM